jgi:hypothetical protein
VSDTQNQPHLSLTVVGFIWDGGDGFDVTARMEGQTDFTRVHVPALVVHARKVCAERGITMGELCDEMNREIDTRERAERQGQGVPSFEFTFTSIDSGLYDLLTGHNPQVRRFQVQWTTIDGQASRAAYVQAVTHEVAVNQFAAAGGVLGEGTITVTEVDAPDNTKTFYARQGEIHA